MSGLCYCKWLGDHFATKFNTLGQTVLEIQPYLRLRFGAPAQCDAAARNAVAGLADRDADLCDRGSAFCERRLSQYDIPQWPVYIRIETVCASQFTSAPFGGELTLAPDFHELLEGYISYDPFHQIISTL